MPDFRDKNVFDNMPSGNPGINMGTSGGMHVVDWDAIGEGGTPSHREYWRENFASRPYVQADRGFDYYEPAYRYGTEAARIHRDRQWNDVEGDLERGWDRARGASHSAWAEVKDAVRDAWNRVRGRG